MRRNFTLQAQVCRLTTDRWRVTLFRRSIVRQALAVATVPCMLGVSVLGLGSCAPEGGSKASLAAISTSSSVPTPRPQVVVPADLLKSIDGMLTAVDADLSVVSSAPSDETDPQAVRAKVDQAVTQRVQRLDELASRATVSKSLTAVHRSALQTEIGLQKDALLALNAKIQSAAEVVPASVDVKKIRTDYRVYSLEVPKVHQVFAADGLQEIAGTLQMAAAQIEDSIASLQASGKDMTSQRVLLDGIKGSLALTSAELTKTTDNLLALQPGGFPANRAILQSSQGKIRAARETLRTSRTGLENLLRVM